MDERDLHQPRDVRDRVRAALEHGERVGHERIEDFAVVVLRPPVGVDVRAVEVSGDEPVRAGSGCHELVDAIGHQHDHHAVVIDVRFPAERRGIDLVEPRVEHGPQRVQIDLGQARFGRGGIDVQGDVLPDLHQRRVDALQGVAGDIHAHLERVDHAGVCGRERPPGRRRRLRGRLHGGLHSPPAACRLDRHGIGATPLRLPQEPMKPLGRTGRSRRGPRCRDQRRHR